MLDVLDYWSSLIEVELGCFIASLALLNFFKSRLKPRLTATCLWPRLSNTCLLRVFNAFAYVSQVCSSLSKSYCGFGSVHYFRSRYAEEAADESISLSIGAGISSHN